MSSFQFEVKTDPSAEFRGALAQNASVDLDKLLPTTLQGINGNGRAQLRSLTVISIQNLSWELWVWRSATHSTLTAAVTAAGSNIIGRWTFTASDGSQVGASGDFVYYIDGLDVPYVDDDNSGKLHLTLVNRSVTGKSANDPGAIQVKVRVESPLWGYAGS